MKKGFLLFEPIFAIILIMMIGNIIVATSYLNKTKADTEFNINMHMLATNQVEQGKFYCKNLVTNTCAEIGGSGTTTSCKLPTYTIKNFYNKNVDVNSICSLESTYLIKIETSIIVDGFEYKGNGYASKI